MNFILTIKMFYFYAKPYRRQFILGILALFAVDLLNVFPPLVLQRFVDQVSHVQGEWDKALGFQPFLWLGVLYLAIALAQGWFRYLWRMFLIRGSHQAAEKLREAYFHKLQKLPSSFYDRNSIGDLMSLATNDTEAVRFALGPGLLVLADALFFLISIPPAMIWLSPKLAFFSLLPMILVPFVIMRTEKLIHDRFEKVQAQFSKLSTFAQENIEGIRIIKAFVREWTQINRFSNLGREFVKLNLKLVKAQNIFEPLFTLAIALGLVFLLIFCGPDVVRGAITLGTFVAFTRYLEQLVWPMMACGLSVTYYERGKTSLERIMAVLNAKEEARLLPRVAYNDVSPILEARNLSFYYPGHSHLALKDLSFCIEKGMRTAMVGLVGSGKSTFVKLLMGLYEVSPGMLFWKGQDVTTLSSDQRRSEIAVSPQEVFLFQESLRWNVALGLDSQGSLDDQSLRRVLQKSGLDREMQSLDLDKPIDERGLNLSVGQKARVALARALLRKGDLFILDDALSSVDVQTEAKALEEVLSLNPETALLMITHRLTRLWQFDQILVLKEGELIEQGSPQELLHSGGLYSRLLDLQRMENEIEIG